MSELTSLPVVCPVSLEVCESQLYCTSRGTALGTGQNPDNPTGYEYGEGSVPGDLLLAINSEVSCAQKKIGMYERVRDGNPGNEFIEHEVDKILIPGIRYGMAMRKHLPLVDEK